MTTAMLTFNPMDIDLKRSCHKTRAEGVCFMEAVAWYGGEIHTYKPACTDLFVASYAITLNDAIPDKYRNDILRPMIAKIAGSVVPQNLPRETRMKIRGDRMEKIAVGNVSAMVQDALEAVGIIDAASQLAELERTDAPVKVQQNAMREIVSSRQIARQARRSQPPQYPYIGERTGGESPKFYAEYQLGYAARTLDPFPRQLPVQPERQYVERRWQGPEQRRSRRTARQRPP